MKVKLQGAFFLPGRLAWVPKVNSGSLTADWHCQKSDWPSKCEFDSSLTFSDSHSLTFYFAFQFVFILWPFEQAFIAYVCWSMMVYPFSLVQPLQPHKEEPCHPSCVQPGRMTLFTVTCRSFNATTNSPNSKQWTVSILPWIKWSGLQSLSSLEQQKFEERSRLECREEVCSSLCPMSCSHCHNSRLSRAHCVVLF